MIIAYNGTRTVGLAKCSKIHRVTNLWTAVPWAVAAGGALQRGRDVLQWGVAAAQVGERARFGAHTCKARRLEEEAMVDSTDTAESFEVESEHGRSDSSDTAMPDSSANPVYGSKGNASPSFRAEEWGDEAQVKSSDDVFEEEPGQEDGEEEKTVSGAVAVCSRRCRAVACAVLQSNPRRSVQGANVLAMIQSAVTLVFAPSVCLYLVTIMTDCTANSPHGSYLDFQVRSSWPT